MRRRRSTRACGHDSSVIKKNEEAGLSTAECRFLFCNKKVSHFCSSIWPFYTGMADTCDTFLVSSGCPHPQYISMTWKPGIQTNLKRKSSFFQEWACSARSELKTKPNGNCMCTSLETGRHIRVSGIRSAGSFLWTFTLLPIQFTIKPRTMSQRQVRVWLAHAGSVETYVCVCERVQCACGFFCKES